jgi:WD40 repeat protein
MKRLPRGLIALTVVLATIASSEGDVLRFQKTIGVGGGAEWSGWMSFVALSRDGRRVASDGPSSSTDGSGGLKIWSFPGGRLLRRLSFHPGGISRDWRYFASEHAVIDMASGKPVFPLTESDQDWALPRFSDDGRYVAFSTAASHPREGQIRIRRTDHGTPVSRFGRRAVFALAFHPNGKTLASGHWDNVTLWKVRSGQRIALLRGFGRYVNGLGFSRDGKLLAAGTDSGSLQIWNVKHRRRLRSIEIGGGQVSDPVFSPDGKLVAAGIYGTGTAWVIDVASGKIVGKAKVSDLGCGSVAFSPNGRYLITPSTGGLITWPYDQGGTVRVFEVRGGRGATRRSPSRRTVSSAVGKSQR